MRHGTSEKTPSIIRKEKPIKKDPWKNGLKKQLD